MTFGDKPLPAMAQIALRRTAEEGAEIHPEAARSIQEVAPLKRLTIPRLELQASVMATRLSATNRRELRLDLERTITLSTA